MLLLAALIGAIVLARRDDTEESQQMPLMYPLVFAALPVLRRHLRRAGPAQRGDWC